MNVYRIPDGIVDAMFGLSDGPADRVLLAAGRRIGELDPHRLERLAFAISVQESVGLVGGLDPMERRRLAALARQDGVDTSDRVAVLRWLRANPSSVDGAVRHVAVSRGHAPRGMDLVVRSWLGDRDPKD